MDRCNRPTRLAQEAEERKDRCEPVFPFAVRCRLLPKANNPLAALNVGFRKADMRHIFMSTGPSITVVIFV